MSGLLILAMTYSVGASHMYTSPCMLAAAVQLQPGDVIEVDPGTYTDACQLTASGTSTQPITVRGVGGARPVFDATGLDLSGSGPVPRAIFQLTNASYWVFEHLELKGGTNGSNNGAAFRVTAGGHDLTVRDCSIHDNQDGAMSDGPSTIVLENNDIFHNGANDGQSHNLYLQGDTVRLVGNHIHDSVGGQNVKLRTRYVELVANVIENAGNYEIDLIQGAYTSMPNANAVLVGNLIIRATSADNNSQTILFGTDNPNDTTPSRNGALYALGNTFVLRNASNQLFHVLTSPSPPPATHVYLTNNIVHATVTGTRLTSDTATSDLTTGSNNFITTGIAGVPAALTGTLTGADPGFAGSADYHLAAGSPAIDAGDAAPMYADGTGAMQNGRPMLEPTPPIGSEPRYVVGGGVDLGAFEYGNAPPVGGDGMFGDDAGNGTKKPGGCCDAGSSGGGAGLLALLVGVAFRASGRCRRPSARGTHPRRRTPSRSGTDRP
ncbi:MAG: hypothetical protein JO257_29420 [Deltaproteobacteria bacterium]|nr:hypothetical protein [Deltaproteobacteria bacterium]